MSSASRLRSVLVAAALGLSALPISAQEDRGLAGAYLAARHASAFSDFEAAATYYTRALTRDPGNAELIENAMLAYVGLGQVDRAVPLARKLQDSGTDSQISSMILLTEQLGDEDYEGALAAIADGATVGPLVDGLVTAWADIGTGDTDAALPAFDEAASTTGLQSFGLYHKALALAVIGDFEAAQTILSGESGSPLRLTRRGAMAQAQILSQLGRNADAIELIDSGFGDDLDPGLAELRSRLDSGDTVPFTLIGDAKDGLAEVFYTVAGALNGEATDSYTLLYTRIAEFLRPDHVDAILLSAALLEAQDRHALATAAYDRVPRDDPAFHAAEIGRAAALSAQGKTDAAIEVLEQLSEARGDQPPVWVTLGDSLRSEERYAEAVEAYDRAIELFGEPEPAHWIVYYARAISYERIDDFASAEPDFRMALELNPGQPQVLNYLGYSYIEKNENLDEAMDMIEEAVAARPEDGYITDSLGWGLFRLGRYDEAVGHMERAAALTPVDPIINDHLGDVYWAVGREIEAQFQWHRALSFDPDPDEAERIRRKLEVGLDEVLEEEGADPLDMADGED
ncbi:tetratricopeptide repeat protein [Tropicimonas sp. IMCC34011]|uniref:tetratricopeptide repeat protein n=1 Tax=Tropicimonas sp. IMCC34011 TaxID=2248759 RepID=UPI000E269C3A|nr:tetratricopeptide repeat protein [Tropicimonas sp. IMCC34011]